MSDAKVATGPFGGHWFGATLEPDPWVVVAKAAERLNARPTSGSIPGLWDAPGYPELTTGQLLDAAAQLGPR